MYRLTRALRHWVALLARALLAGGLMFHWSARSENARALVQQVLRVKPWMFVEARKYLGETGALGAVKGPAAGIPYKIYAVSALGAGVSARSFLAASVPARGWRPMLVWVGFSLLGALLLRFQRPHWRLPVAAAFWTVSTTLYWINLS